MVAGEGRDRQDACMAHNDALDGLASVRKAFALLDAVATDSRGMTAKEIAAALQMPLPTVYRMLKTLVASGHVVHLREESRYGLGYKLHTLDTSLRRQVGTPPAVARLIQELHSRADAAAYYAVHRGRTSSSPTWWIHPPTPGSPLWGSDSTMPPTPPRSARSCSRRWTRSDAPSICNGTGSRP